MSVRSSPSHSRSNWSATMNRRKLIAFCLLGFSRPMYGAVKSRARGVLIANGVFGLLSPDGWVVGRLWRRLIQSEGSGLVMVQDGETGKFGFIDGDGANRVPFEWDDAGWFNDGFAPVCKTGKWGLINQDGNKTAQFRWDDALSLSNGLCPVRRGGKWGYINSRGDVVIEPAWDEAKIFPTPDGLARVRSGDKWGYIDQEGRTVITPAYEHTRPFYGAATFVMAKGNGRWRCIDRGGKTLSETSWSHCLGFPFIGRQRLAAVQDAQGKMGCIDESGTYVIPPIFEWIGEFHRSHATGKKEGSLRVINEEGEDVVVGNWDNISEPSFGFAATEKGGLQGYVELATGREIKPQWERVDSFGVDFGVAYHKRRIALISQNGEVAGRWFDQPINSNWQTKAQDAYPAQKMR